MPENQLEAFMGAIRALESGGGDPRGDYNARGPLITNPNSQYHGERAHGAYGIMPGNWDSWSRAAGLGGADIRDPRAQDAVARHMFERYYAEFGSWDLVAIAWFAGAGNARKAQRRGIASLSEVRDTQGTDPKTGKKFKGTSVPDYVTKIRHYMGTPSDSFEAAAKRSVESGEIDPALTPEPNAKELTNANMLGREVVKMVSGMVKQNPGAGAHDAINRAFRLEA